MQHSIVTLPALPMHVGRNNLFAAVLAHCVHEVTFAPEGAAPQLSFTSGEQLTAPAIELWFGRIDRTEGFVFVNGRKIGLAGEPQSPSIYDVEALIHPGENTVALALANYSNDLAAGITRGMTLRFPGAPAPVRCERSVFNGLAQITVQPSPTGGTLRLTAQAGTLTPATAAIEAIPGEQPPALP